jgi:hypothetical protein
MFSALFSVRFEEYTRFSPRATNMRRHWVSVSDSRVGLVLISTGAVPML